MESQIFFNVGLAKFENNQILLDKIIYRFQVTEWKILIGLALNVGSVFPQMSIVFQQSYVTCPQRLILHYGDYRSSLVHFEAQKICSMLKKP